MRTITVYSTKLIENGKPFDTDEYTDSYLQLGSLVTAAGGKLYLGQYAEAYLGDATFAHGWIFENGGFRRAHKPFKADLIFNKSSGLDFGKTTWVINHPELVALSLKHNTVKLCAEFMPKSLLTESREALQANMEQISGDLIVLKPLEGYGGQGVYIGKKQDIPYDTLRYPLLAQEFIDSSPGIPGISDSIHDLRIIYFGGVMGDAYIRSPKESGYVSNVAMGGSIWQIPLSAIPQEAQELCAAVDRKLEGFTDRHYCIDLALHKEREWKIIELNAPPGFPVEGDGPNISIYMEQLAEHLLKAERSPETVLPPGFDDAHADGSVTPD